MKVVRIEFRDIDVARGEHKLLIRREGHTQSITMLRPEIMSWLVAMVGVGERFYVNEMTAEEHLDRLRQAGTPHTWAHTLRCSRRSPEGYLELWFDQDQHAVLFKLMWGGK